MGLVNETQVKSALKAALKAGAIEIDGGSYALGGATRSALAGAEAEAYEAVYEAALEERADKAASKSAGRARAEQQYARNINEACKDTPRGKHVKVVTGVSRVKYRVVTGYRTVVVRR